MSTTLSLQPDASIGLDATIRSFNPTFNYGTDNVIYTGFDASSGGIRRGLIKFNLSSIPNGVTIISATLSLYCITEVLTTDFNVAVHRGLTTWFEGTHNGGAPTAGQDGSTWNLRNANGSVAWAGGVGGAAGSDWTTTATATTLITGPSTWFDWDVSADVDAFVNSAVVNNGWWVRGVETGGSTTIKGFVSSDDSSRPDFYPKLVVVYATNLGSASAAGTSTATATLKGKGTLSGLGIGSSTIVGNAFSNAIQGSIDGTSTVTGALGASGKGFISIAGTSTASAVIHGKTHLVVTIAGISTLSADGSFRGLLRGATISGLGILTAIGVVIAKNIITGKGCYSDPLLFITDGSLQQNNQLNLLNLIDSKIGFLLDDWKPIISQYKDGGTFSDSPNSTGRNLVKRVFANAIEVFTFSIRGHDEDDLIWYIQQLMSWQEAAADYWTSDNPFLPVYIGAKAAKEKNVRYATIKAMSSPQLDNPYAQPFALRNNTAVIDKFTLRLERGDWMSNPPGQSECVAISSQRAWTIAGWSIP